MTTLRVYAAAIVATVLSATAHAQSYPTKPITMVVPFPAGGPHDVVARPLAQFLSQRLGQSVVIDNRPGAGGTIGTRAVTRAGTDGHTLLFGSVSSLATAPALYKDAGYDPLKS